MKERQKTAQGSFSTASFLFDTHLSPLSKGEYMAQATVSKPVPESPFHYSWASLSFGTIVSMEGGDYDFRVTLTRPTRSKRTSSAPSEKRARKWASARRIGQLAGLAPVVHAEAHFGQLFHQPGRENILRAWMTTPSNVERCALVPRWETRCLLRGVISFGG